MYSLPPPPKLMFVPLAQFIHSYWALFALILHYFAFILPFNFPFSLFFSPFLLFLSHIPLLHIFCKSNQLITSKLLFLPIDNVQCSKFKDGGQQRITFSRLVRPISKDHFNGSYFLKVTFLAEHICMYCTVPYLISACVLTEDQCKWQSTN